MSTPAPTLDFELALAARCGPGRRIVVGIDEVGRGALAGPVAVGACAIEIIDGRTPALPEGVRDSKKLTARRREALVEPLRAAAAGSAVGWASPGEIDEVGIMPALTRAALRALEALELEIDAILLDGDVDVLSAALASASGTAPLVELRVAADRDCASVSAASVLAKVARDALMVELDEQTPDYCWASNKGYGSAVHREAIDRLGAHEQHRRSWRLTSTVPALAPPAPPSLPAPLASPAPPAAAPRLETPSAPAEPRRSDPAVVEAAASTTAAGVLWDDDWHLYEGKERR
ncbi:ribonuclease HII [Brachybacterium paraconglomeratum]|uniref:ribonuclease HII n=1 Tax=Brachybacterium paraconglomeratum TaxID=173362 RepID=UPI0031E962E4